MGSMGSVGGWGWGWLGQDAAGLAAVLLYSEKVLALSPIAYWPLWEAAGAVAEDISGNGFDGAYTGVTLGQTGIGDGNF